MTLSRQSCHTTFTFFCFIFAKRYSLIIHCIWNHSSNKKVSCFNLFCRQYVNELKSRINVESSLQNQQSQQKRPIRGSGLTKDDKGSSGKQESMQTESVLRKVDCYMQEIQHLLLNVTSNTDRLLGRNSHAESPDRGYT